MVGVMKIMGSSFKRSHAWTAVISVLTLQQATVYLCLCQRHLNTHRKSGSVSCGVSVPFSWFLVA